MTLINDAVPPSPFSCKGETLNFTMFTWEAGLWQQKEEGGKSSGLQMAVAGPGPGGLSLGTGPSWSPSEGEGPKEEVFILQLNGSYSLLRNRGRLFFSSELIVMNTPHGDKLYPVLQPQNDAFCQLEHLLDDDG